MADTMIKLVAGYPEPVKDAKRESKDPQPTENTPVLQEGQSQAEHLEVEGCARKDEDKA